MIKYNYLSINIIIELLKLINIKLGSPKLQPKLSTFCFCKIPGKVEWIKL